MSNNLINEKLIIDSKFLLIDEFKKGDIPKDYLQWLSKQDNLDEDMRYTV
ncbi:MAG: hypothetical protein KAJ62_07380 [Desulfobacteraceae bacterium]|nr:hypothetical protein [Desulfobacteraceae bacterium]